MEFDTERPRGTLSPADREFLLGNRELTHDQSRRNAEARIRQRVIHSIKDFNLLVHALKPKDRRQIFEKSLDDPEFMDGLTAMLSFAYLGVKESGIEFANVLEPAIRRTEETHAANRLGTMVTVEVEFSVDTQPQTEIEELRARLTAADPITPPELFSVLVADGNVPDEVDTIIVKLETDTDQPRGHEMVANLVEYLDADIEELPMNRIRLHL